MSQNALYGTIIGSVIGIILIVVGIVVEKHKTVYSQLGNGRVTHSYLVGIPTFDYDQSGRPILPGYNLWSGSITVLNTNDPNKKELTFDLKGIKTFTAEDPYSRLLGKDLIQIWVNPNNPSDFRLTTDNVNILGWVLLGVGIFLTLVLWISYFFRNKKNSKN